ncbi:DUF805 domain-containing protein [Rhizobium sp.]|uniref:DUF805 domain-containing protein n=1 Tax=Rhizobium sp. TaxID=391 RepID=UPI002EFB6188
MTSLFLNDRLNRPTYWMFICIFLGFRVGAVVLTEMGYVSDLLRHVDFVLFFVASAMGSRLRDFGWSAFWGWAGVAVFSFVVPIGMIEMFKPVILPEGGMSGAAGSYSLLFSTLPFFALVVAVGLPPSDPNSNYGRPSRYNIVVSESTQQFAQRWILRPLSIFRGRVSRSAYWAGLVIVFAVLFARVVAEGNSNEGAAPGVSLFILAIVVVAMLVAARLRDFGWSGIWGWGAIGGLCFVVQGMVLSVIEADQMSTLPAYVKSGPNLLCLAIIVGVGIPRGNPDTNKYGRPFRWRSNKVVAQ